jgi:lipid-binding SYLF domain-containing protein
MNSKVLTFLLLGLVLSAQAVNKTDLDKRLRLFAAKFEEMQAKPELRVPADKLSKACGIVMLHRSKGGLVFGYEGGGGVAMVKDPHSGKWSPPVFMKSNDGSFGAQIGGQTSFTVILLMNTNSVRTLTESSFKFGGQAAGTAGNASGKEESTTTAAEELTLVYSDTSGLYGGAVVKGGTLAPDSDANVAYYGEYLTAKEILFDNKVKRTEAATGLADKITLFSK